MKNLEGITWSKFNALPFELRDSVERFWEPGYDYDEQDFWSCYDNPTNDFIEAVQMYDYLKRNVPNDE